MRSKNESNLQLFRIAVIVILAGLAGGRACAQTYDSLVNIARSAIKSKEYQQAVNTYRQAFALPEKANAYNYYSAAGAAANCEQQKLAFEWLDKAAKGGLGLKPGEIPYIEKDPALVSLHNEPAWQQFVDGMKNNYAAMIKAAEEKKARWMHQITAAAIGKKTKGVFAKAPAGPALYFAPADTFNVPYLVYVPKDYDRRKPAALIVYLHGGVVSTDRFQHENPETLTEPVFQLADTCNAVVLYPFGQKRFGWAKQPAAFEHVFSMIEQVKERYNIHPGRIVLGGMSNGGTAAYWFASRKPNIFRGFFDISGNPELNSAIDAIRFENLSQGKPFYSIHAADDEVFPLAKVMTVYDQHAAVATDWKLIKVDKGGHAFMFDPKDGTKALKPVLEQLLK